MHSEWWFDFGSLSNNFRGTYIINWIFMYKRTSTKVLFVSNYNVNLHVWTWSGRPRINAWRLWLIHNSKPELNLMIQSWSRVSPNITSQWSNPDPKWAQILHHNDPILIQSEPKYHITMIQSWSKVSPNITSQWSNPDPKWAQILHHNDPILIQGEPKYYITMIQSWSKVSPNITSQWSNPDPKWAQILYDNDPDPSVCQI